LRQAMHVRARPKLIFMGAFLQLAEPDIVLPRRRESGYDWFDPGKRPHGVFPRKWRPADGRTLARQCDAKSRRAPIPKTRRGKRIGMLDAFLALTPYES